MSQIDLKSLIGKLSPPAKNLLEQATSLCYARTNYNIEVEHWLCKLVENDASIQAIVKHYGVSLPTLEDHIIRAIDRLKSGNAKAPALSPDIVDWIQTAWLQASLREGAREIQTADLLLALISSDRLALTANHISSELHKIDIEDLKNRITEFLPNAQKNEATGERQAEATSSKGALDQFTVDLTLDAKAGKIDPVLGRDAEIRQMIDILTRRRQNNPILTGEAGVGKTAVVEGLALRIAAGDVPDKLKEVSIRVLDLALLQAGASVKGEFENRLKSVISEVKKSTKPIILFIDEAHTLIGAGGAEGQNDAANLLKPALARGELRTIGATTWAEYKKYFEKDPALARRFQPVKVDEPTIEAAIDMMRGIAAHLEKHHGVRILDEAIVASVQLSKRYIQGRQLPDKCVSLLDTACAKVAMSHASIPAIIEDCTRRLEQITVEKRILTRESVIDTQHQERLIALNAEEQKVSEEKANLEAQLLEEKKLVTDLRDIRTKLEAGETDENLKKSYLEKQAALKVLQGEKGMLQPEVNAETVAEVIAGWTGIPVGKMLSDEIASLLRIEDELQKRVIGQDHALESIARTIRVSRANLGDPRKPIGVFMLAGTSGTGKTETALALANLLYGGEQNLTVINMSEFKEEHKVSMLVGSPPGYVGYGEGGVLTNAVRRKPYSVILLDEIEKAHPGVQDIFYQVFDKGTIMDGEGREIDFKNTVIIMTTNAGTHSIMKAYSGPEEEAPNNASELSERIRPELLKTFKPAFLGRITVIPYIPLDAEVITSIVKLQLQKVADRVHKHYGAALQFSDKLIETITARCTEVETGARTVESLINHHLLPELSAECLAKLAAGESFARITLDVDEAGGFIYTFE
jgi:type VI secretion system protein VasG